MWSFGLTKLTLSESFTQTLTIHSMPNVKLSRLMACENFLSVTQVTSTSNITWNLVLKSNKLSAMTSCDTIQDDKQLSSLDKVHLLWRTYSMHVHDIVFACANISCLHLLVYFKMICAYLCQGCGFCCLTSHA